MSPFSSGGDAKGRPPRFRQRRYNGGFAGLLRPAGSYGVTGNPNTENTLVQMDSPDDAAPYHEADARVTGQTLVAEDNPDDVDR